MEFSRLHGKSPDPLAPPLQGTGDFRKIHFNSRFLSEGDSGSTAFNALKKTLTSAPILACPDFSKGFILQTDASTTGLGAVLTQNFPEGKRVIAYESRTAERNYTATELKCGRLGHPNARLFGGIPVYRNHRSPIPPVVAKVGCSNGTTRTMGIRTRHSTTASTATRAETPEPGTGTGHGTSAAHTRGGGSGTHNRSASLRGPCEPPIQNKIQYGPGIPVARTVQCNRDCSKDPSPGIMCPKFGHSHGGG